MSQTIKLEKCALTAIEGKKRNGIVTSKLKFAAIFDQAAAKAIGVEYTLFQKGGDIRTGYASLELDFRLADLKLFYVVKGFETHALDLRSHSADKFVIRKKGDGKKKPSKLVVTFNVLHIGQYLELANWWERYGGADGVLTLTPQQTELPLAEAAEQPKRGRGRPPKQKPLVAAAGGSVQ